MLLIYGLGLLIGAICLVFARDIGAFGWVFGFILSGGSGWMIYRTLKKRIKPARKNESAEITFPAELSKTGETRF